MSKMLISFISLCSVDDPYRCALGIAGGSNIVVGRRILLRVNQLLVIGFNVLVRLTDHRVNGEKGKLTKLMR